jgi:hypothetical protein
MGKRVVLVVVGVVAGTFAWAGAPAGAKTICVAANDTV